LKRGQFCVFATVHYRDEGFIDNFAKSIVNFRENVDQGNLLIVDLAPLYIAALVDDMKPFEDAKKLFADRAKGRTNDHIRFVGDGTGFLFKNMHIDECAAVEQWWHQKPFNGSYVCPFSKDSINSHPHSIHAKRVIFANHDVAVDASSHNEHNELHNRDEKHQRTTGGER
jgi:hypothetical protein